jgi:RNA polymerase sigma-70 factor (ECF subfamily)
VNSLLVTSAGWPKGAENPMSLTPTEKTAPGSTLTPEQIFRENAARVYTVARRLVGNDADADDVSQDVFVQVMRKLSTFRGESTLSTWLYRVTVNVALSYRRKYASRREHRLPEFLENSRQRATLRRKLAQPEQLALDQEAHRLIEMAIGRLPKLYRDAYVLADVQELANAQIATILGLSVAAIKTRVRRARLLMRKLLAS